MVEIKGLEQFAPRDFPGYICATVFVGGCNFRCPYCHNAGLVLDPGRLKSFPPDFFLGFLNSRKNWLEAVCVTGGEPLMHEDLEVLLRLLKDRDLHVKVDTNGAFPVRLEHLIDKGLVDLVAMDVKASFDRYEEAAGTSVNVSDIRASMELIKESGMDSMFRTTAVPGLIDEKGMETIAEAVRGAELFQLQQFHPDNTLDKALATLEPFPLEKLHLFAEIVRPYVTEVRIMGG